MEKRISFDQFQSVKRVAQACNPLMSKRESVRKKIESLVEEFKEYDTQISQLEAGIKEVMGFRVEELVKKVIESGVDANGKPKKTTKYVPTDIVTYDTDKKQYVITIHDEPEATDLSSIEIPKEETPAEQPVEQAEQPAPASEEVPTDAPIFD